jgi:hypothetical protein
MARTIDDRVAKDGGFAHRRGFPRPPSPPGLAAAGFKPACFAACRTALSDMPTAFAAAPAVAPLEMASSAARRFSNVSPLMPMLASPSVQ